MRFFRWLRRGWRIVRQLLAHVSWGSSREANTAPPCTESDPSYFPQMPGKASANRATKALLQAVGLILLLCEHSGSLVSHHTTKLFFPCVFKDCRNQPGPGRGCKREDRSNPFSYREGEVQRRLCCLYIWLVMVKAEGMPSG